MQAELIEKTVLQKHLALYGSCGMLTCNIKGQHTVKEFSVISSDTCERLLPTFGGLKSPNLELQIYMLC